MTAGERVPREVIIGKPTSYRGASGFIAFLDQWQWRLIQQEAECYIEQGDQLWKLATDTDFGRKYWGETLDGWTFEELKDDLDEIAWSMRRTDRDDAEGIMGALWRRGLNRNEDKPWIIPDLLRQGDRMMVTGETGAGKSLLLAQIGVQVAAGIHPFTGEEIERRDVLIVDPENPRDEVLERLDALLSLGDATNGAGEFLNIRTPPELDLSTPKGWKRLESWASDTALLLIGPLNRIVRGDLNDKTTADPILDGLNRQAGLRTIILEAHPTKDGGAGPPSGYAGWSSWPEIGIGITKSGTIKPWRPPRRDGIILPARLERDQRWDRSRWPFRPVTTGSTGTTAGDLSSVVLDFLTRHAGEEFSRTKLGDQLRDEGATFSNRALPEAIETLIENGSIIETKVGKASILRILRDAPSSSAEETEEPRKSVEPSSSGGASLEAPEEDGSEDGGDDLGDLDGDFETEADGGWLDDELY
jgi:hypothetical protein